MVSEKVGKGGSMMKKCFREIGVFLVLDLILGICVTFGYLILPMFESILLIAIFLVLLFFSITAIIDRLSLSTKIDAISKYYNFNDELTINLAHIDRANIIWDKVDDKTGVVIFDAEHFIIEPCYVKIDELWFDPADEDVLSVRMLEE